MNGSLVSVNIAAPTTAAITARDLQIRLYQFADDSMMGRQVGRLGNYKGTTLIANEVRDWKSIAQKANIKGAE